MRSGEGEEKVTFILRSMWHTHGRLLEALKVEGSLEQQRWRQSCATGVKHALQMMQDMVGQPRSGLCSPMRPYASLIGPVERVAYKREELTVIVHI